MNSMTIRDLIEQEIDVDVYDDVCDEIGIAFCGPLRLTEQGKKKFLPVLDYPVRFVRGCQVVVVCVDDLDDKVWRCRLRLAKEFFYAAAGYCAADDYDIWFEQEE